jgi:hypothetical protein
VTLVRKNHGKGHSYYLDGEKVPGVTTILGGTLPKNALVEWAGRTTAGYAVDYWEELAELPPSKRLDRLNRARFEDRDNAARRGGDVHRLGATLVGGEEVAVPDELAGHVASYVDFLNTYDPKPVLVETVIGNRACRYCGTFDLVADMGGERWLLDLKTGRSGIFPETALQLAAYRRAEFYLGVGGEEVTLSDLGITRLGAVHIRADGWELREVLHEAEVWEVFRHLAWVYRRIEGDRDREWISAPVEAS